MASPTNLTESISKLREHDRSFFQRHPAAIPVKMRQMAKDYFTLFAYGLFVAAVLAQLALIVWLDFL